MRVCSTSEFVFLGEQEGRSLAKGLVSGEGWWGKKYVGESGADARNFSLAVILSSEFPPFSPAICLLVRGLSPFSAAEDIMRMSLIYLL